MESLSENADMSTAAILRDNHGNFLFAIQKPERWKNKDINTPYIAFGGIGGKLEKDESPDVALLREMQEEIGVNGKILDITETIVFMTPHESTLIEAASVEGVKKPVIIYRNPQQEAGRKPFTDVWIFAASGDLENAKPMDNPAIIYLDEKLLKEINENEITLEEALKKGAKIKSNIDLPSNGILFALPTPRAISRYFEDSKAEIILKLRVALDSR